ncbi:hypothetical protein H0H81_007146, partial [Sphagnurus paluster]
HTLTNYKPDLTNTTAPMAISVFKLFEALWKPKNMSKLINHPVNGAGQRVFPSRTAKSDNTIGVRIDQGVTLADGSVILNVQENGKPHGKVLASVIVRPDDTPRDVYDRLKGECKKNPDLTFD